MADRRPRECRPLRSVVCAIGACLPSPLPGYGGVACQVPSPRPTFAPEVESRAELPLLSAGAVVQPSSGRVVVLALLSVSRVTKAFHISLAIYMRRAPPVSGR